jgi:adenylate cyclase
MREGAIDPAAVERRLTAILAADVVGYSRLMEQDETATLVALKAHRKALINPAIARHHGRIVKTTGDGMLVEFPSVVEAVQCAVEVQHAMPARNADVPEDRHIQFRVGINLGDVIVDSDDIYGDGVNIAARLEGLAEPGGICVSRAARDAVAGKLPVRFEDMGEQHVKNIAKPLRVFRVRYADDDWAYAPPTAAEPRAPRRIPALAIGVIAGGLVVAATLLWWDVQFATRSPTVAPQASVEPLSGASIAIAPAMPALPTDRVPLVVLPFDNLSGDPNQAYFSDGITEDLTTDLSKLSGLLVIARKSAFAYKGRPVNLAQVARELGVRYVVEGSVRKAGDRVRITAQLIDASTGHHVWGERYDRELRDIFDLQDDVRQKIVAALAVQLKPGEREQLLRRPTNNVAAYDLWARGLEQMNTFTREGVFESRRLFEQAVALDPGFARAWGQIANTYALAADLEVGVATPEDIKRAITMAERAVTLDPALPQPRWALTRIHFWQHDVERALAEIQKAITLDPNYADGLAYHGLLLVYAGRAPAAFPYIERAMRINPHFPFWYIYALGNAQFMVTRYDAAAESYRKALERNPNWQPARRMLVAAYGHLGQIDDARWEIAELRAAGYEAAISDYRRTMLIRYHPSYFERIIEGLQKAGVPEAD